jgi:hypothetical protein
LTDRAAASGHPGERPHRVVRYVNAELLITATDECLVRVELRRDSGETYVGESSGPCDPAETLQSAGRAAINAVCEAASLTRGEIKLEGVSLSETFGHRTVLVAILAQDSPTPLVGSCVVVGDTSRATALAVLNATNRFLGIG